MPVQLWFGSLVLLTVGLNTLAQVLFKAGAGASLLNGYCIGGIVTYGISTLVYLTVLSKLNLSMAYPVVIGLTVIATTVAGVWLFKEKVNMVNWMGIGLMISGICAVAFGRSA